MRLLLVFALLIAAAAAHMYSCQPEQCQCEGLCTNGFSYWQSHNAYNWFAFLRRPWPVPADGSGHSEDRTLCGGRLKWFDAIRFTVGKPNDMGFGKPQIELVREWIAAQLNQWMGACTTPRIDELMTLSHDLIEQWCGTMVLSDSETGQAMDQLAASLRLYNGGSLGPGACGCGDGVLQEHEDCDLGRSQNGEPGACCTSKCTLAPVGTLCRAADGACDTAEYCTGSDPVCPPDGFLSEDTVCRPAVGTCDRTEHCTGHSAQCPHDGLRRAGWVCRAAEGGCDQAEVCDGVTAECPPDEIHEVGHVCRDLAGTCDLAEVCDGTSRGCPDDKVSPSGTICREAENRDPCDCTDVCDGQSASCPVHVTPDTFEYAVLVDTVSDTFEGGPSGSSGTLSWADSSWILHQRGAGQEVSIEDGNLNITYLSTSGISARRATPAPRDPAHLASLTLKGKVVLSRASAPVRVIISVAPKACSEVGADDAVWCGLVRSASDERLTTQPLVTPSGREVPCDGLNLARRLMFHAEVDPKPFRETSDAGCVSVWVGTSEGAGVRPTTLLFNDLTLEARTEIAMDESPICGAILVPDAGQSVATGSCPLTNCPESPGCLTMQ